MAKVKTKKAPRKRKPSDAQLAKRTLAAADQAARSKWYLVSDAVLLAVNPNNSSEVWTFYPEENLWKRLGDYPVSSLPLL